MQQGPTWRVWLHIFNLDPLGYAAWWHRNCMQTVSADSTDYTTSWPYGVCRLVTQEPACRLWVPTAQTTQHLDPLGYAAWWHRNCMQTVAKGLYHTVAQGDLHSGHTTPCMDIHPSPILWGACGYVKEEPIAPLPSAASLLSVSDQSLHINVHASELLTTNHASFKTTLAWFLGWS